MRRIAVPGLVALAAVLGASAAASAAPVTPRTAYSRYGIAAASVAAVAAVAAQPASYAGPASTASTPPRHMLVAVSCEAAKSCAAVGADVGTHRPMAERWNGTKWTGGDVVMPRGATLGVLTSVACPSASHCVAVGLTGASLFAGSTGTEAPLAETWNGKTWSPSQPPEPSGSDGGAQLGGVSCPTTSVCVATGAYFLASGNAAGFADVIRDGKWTVYKLPGLSSNSYSSVVQNVSCLSTVDCVAVGDYGVNSSPGGAPSNVVFAEYWNGTGWHKATLPMPAGAKGAWLYDVSCVAKSKTCVATGGRGIAGGKSLALAETLTAGKWKVSTPYAAGGDPSLYAVSCVTAADCLAAGGGDTPSVLNNAFSDAWNGHAWKFGRLPTPREGGSGRTSAVWGVSCVSATDCVAVGSAGSASLYPYGFSGFWNGKSWRLVALA